MVYFGLLLFPLALIFRQAAGRPRVLAVAYTGIIALLGATAVIAGIFDIRVIAGFRTASMFQGFLWGAVLSTWLGTFIGSERIGK